MRKTLILLSVCGLGLLAATSEFWRDKGYTQWTSDEVDKMLSDSPWAQSSKASAQQQQSPSRGMGRRGGGMGIPGMGGGGMGRGGGGYPSGGGQSMPQVTATVRWQSALPVREALLRRDTGVTKPDDAQVAASLTAPINGYVIAVMGLPETPPSSRGGYGGYGGRGTDTDRDDDSSARGTNSRDETTDHSLDLVKSATYLSRKDKATLFADKAQRDKDGVTLLFTFPKTTPITLDDKEVEFVTRYGSLEVKRKFKLKDMVYQGKLEL